MSKKFHVQERRSARKAIVAELNHACREFFNSMCRLPLKRRIRLAIKILFKHTLKEIPGK